MIETSTATRDPEDVTRDPRVEPLVDRPVGHNGTRVEVNEQRAWAVSGFLVLPFALLLVGVAIWQVVLAAQAGKNGSPMGWYFGVAGACLVLAILLAAPLVVIAPGETRVVQFFGRYTGTVRRTGLTWVVPLSTRRRVSVRVRNFETNALGQRRGPQPGGELRQLRRGAVRGRAPARLDHPPLRRHHRSGTSLPGSTDMVSTNSRIRSRNGSSSP